MSMRMQMRMKTRDEDEDSGEKRVTNIGVEEGSTVQQTFPPIQRRLNHGEVVERRRD